MVKFAAASCILCFLLCETAAVGNETVLLDFASPHCPPCRQMEPLIHSLATAGYPIRKVDVTREQPLAAQYNVTRVPCFVMLAGGREIDRVVGATSQARLETMFQRARDELARFEPTRRGQSLDTAEHAGVASDPWAGAGTPAASQPPIGALAMNTAPTALGASATLTSNTMPSAAMAAVDPQFVPLVNSSVRLRIEDGQNRAFGTGTIIDARSGEALVITCGHLFRDTKGQAPVTIELFESTAGGVRPVGQLTGKVISYDLDRDIGLVSIRPDRPVAVARVAPAGSRIEPGDRAASVGCSNGDNPTALATRITQIGRYQGPPNIEAAGAPVVGRSGGGLFDEHGQLVGVCFAADKESNEGLYAALDSIHHELDRIGLSEIYVNTPEAVEGDSIPVETATATLPIVRGQEPPPPVMPQNAAGGLAVSNPAEQAALEEIFARTATSEVICIIRPKAPGGQSEVITLDEVSPEFIREIARQRREAGGNLLR
jgi:thiol-disulfide isomerase/thioredoxin